MQVRLYPHAVWSSLARTDSHGHLQIAMKKTLRSNREGWEIKSNRLEVLHFFRWFTHTHPWARKYNERLPVAREDMRKPSVHSAIRKSRTSRIKQRIRSERCFASFASCSSWLENIPEWWLQTKEIEKDWKSMGKATPCYFNGGLLTSCLSEDHYLSLFLSPSPSLLCIDIIL